MMRKRIIALATVFFTGAMFLKTAAKPTKADRSTKVITKTIVVKTNTVYDGKGQTIVAKGLGDGSQSENQKPIFKLEKGATLINVRIAAPGADGIHCYGDNIVENVIWEDVGKDALTVKGEGTVIVNSGEAYKADDKVFQINKPCTFKVSNFKVDNFGKLIRQKGGTTFKVDIYLKNITASNGKEAIVRTDSKTTQIYYRNLKVENVKKLFMVPSVSQVHQYK